MSLQENEFKCVCNYFAYHKRYDNIIGQYYQCCRCGRKYFADSTNICTLENVHFDIVDLNINLKKLKNEIQNIKLDLIHVATIVKDLDEKIHAVYYAPHMPGYYEALGDYCKNNLSENVKDYE